MKYVGCLAALLSACGAAEADESLWSDNPIGGGNAFVAPGNPTATASPGGTVPAPTGTTTVGAPIPTTAAPPTAMPTGTVVPVPTGTVTPTPTGTVTPIPTGTVAPTPTEPVPVAGPVGPCAFQLDFSTATYGGRYGPRHVEAAWIENAAGQFVKTLEAFGTIRIGNLVTWNRLSVRNTVDAVTGATIFAHRAHSVTWDCMDLTNNPIPEGNYRVGLELTEDDSASFFGPPTHQVYVDFVRSAQPVDLFAPDTQSFVGVHLVIR